VFNGQALIDMSRYRVCGVDEDGYPQVQASDLSQEEAIVEMNSLSDLFPDTIYFVELDEDEEKEQEPMRRMNGVVDGWEDLFPDYD
jgi:hypothetical protein